MSDVACEILRRSPGGGSPQTSTVTAGVSSTLYSIPIVTRLLPSG